MPRLEKDQTQPGVYRFVESEEERLARQEKEDLLVRVEALEKHLEPLGFKVPTPVQGFTRRR